MKRISKILLLILKALAIFIFAIVYFISPITKYIIETKSEDLIGRKIIIGDLKINLLNGHILINDLSVMEKDKKTVFFSAAVLETQINMIRAISSTYHIEKFKLDKYYLHIVQDADHFNFDDLMEQEKDTITVKENVPADTVPTRYIIDNFSLTNGSIDYNYSDYKLKTTIQGIMLECKSIRWDQPLLKFLFSFMLNTGGSFRGKFNLDAEKLDYLIESNVKNFDLAITTPFVTPFINISEFRSFLDIDFITKGNFNVPDSLVAKGDIAVRDFLIKDIDKKEIVSFASLQIEIDTFNTANMMWKLGKIILDKPSLNFELFREGDNLSRLYVSDTTAAEDGATTASGESVNPFKMIAGYISDLTSEMSIADYKIDEFKLSGGRVRYIDHTLNDRFEMVISPLNLNLLPRKNSSDPIKATMDAIINKVGVLNATFVAQANNMKDFDLVYSLKTMNLSDYNPYSVYYVAYPFTKGQLNYEGRFTVINSHLDNNNMLLVEQVKVGKKIKSKTAANIPLKLAVALLKDRKGNIQLELPVSGNLDDPEYKYRKALLSIVSNILVKAATAPYNLLASAFKAKEEEFKELPFDYMQEGLNSKQQAQLDKILAALKEKEDIRCIFNLSINNEREKELLSYYEAKKQYYFKSKNLSVPDSIDERIYKDINSVDNTDSLFINYVEEKSATKGQLLSLSEKCIRLCGEASINGKLKNLNLSRQSNLIQAFANKGFGGRIILKTADPAKYPPEFQPKYIIEYDVIDD